MSEVDFQSFRELEIQVASDQFQKDIELLNLLKSKLESPDFWASPEAAQISQQKIKLDKKITPLLSIHNQVLELTKLRSSDPSLEPNIELELQELYAEYLTIKEANKYQGPYDDHNVIIKITAGAGGADASDWAGMLLKMYLAFSIKNKYEHKLLEQTDAEIAGIKGATFTIKFENAYGKLKGDSGVHRLVRLSPFNSGHTRETSFAMVEVLPQIENNSQVEVNPKDIRVDVYRSQGSGGQSVNTTDSAVRITHIPTGIVVAIQNERSQIQNRETAMQILKSKLAQLMTEQQKSNLEELRSPNQDASWGNQIRNYVMHPYTLVKDTRTKIEDTNVESVLAGNIDRFLA